jgi:lipopolysaccharide export system permease protein
MGSIGRYIFRNAMGAFVLVLVSLTAAIWLTQALRDIDLITSQGQTILVFIGITGLIIPLVIQVLTPIALVIAVAHVLQKLSNDSEIIVMNGAGMRPWRLFWPFVAVTLVITAALSVVIAYIAPAGLRMLRDRVIEARADLVTNIVQPGRFTQIDRGLAFHIRERRPNGLLVGIMLDDRRDEKERVTIIAEQGEILKTEHGSFLILENGSIQRHETKSRDPNIVRFERYAFDLTRFASFRPLNVKLSVRERYLWELTSPDPKEPNFKEQQRQFWAEFHDRIFGLFYPIAFVVIAYTFLGAPRTTRQSTTWSLIAVIIGVSALRLAGFAGTIVTLNYPSAVFIQYLLIGGTLLAGGYAISKGLIIEPPAHATRLMNAISEWYLRRIGATAGQTS